MAQIFAQPFYTAITAAGNVVSGAKLYFYRTGTLTPQTVYSDDDLAPGHAHTNPVVADSAGRFPAIYLDGTLVYRVKLTESNDALIKDVDPVNATDDTFASTAFTASGIGATTGASVQTRFGDRPNVIRDFGAKGDGTTDDTAAWQAFVNACQSYKKTGEAPGTGSLYKITAPISISGTGGGFEGSGIAAAILKASGNFASVFSFTGTAAERFARGVSVDTTSTTTKAVEFLSGAQAINLRDCQFKGTLAGSLVYSQAGGYVDFEHCRWDMDGASTVGLELDMFNQNTRVHSASRFGGIGMGMRISKSGASARVEGTCIENVQFINTGAFSLDIGNSLLTQVIGCNLDQAEDNCIAISNSADQVEIIGNWLGLNDDGTGVCVSILATAGNGHIIQGNVFFGGDTAIGIGASVTDNVAGVLIANNVFSGHDSVTLSLDSVTDCRIIGNRDQSTPTAGSWITSATFGAGNYLFDNNRWHTTIPALYHTGSVYRFGNDTGIVGRNSGANAPGGAVTTLTISHGLFRTPRVVVVAPNGAAGAFNTLNHGATTFDVSWGTAGTPSWNWMAEV